MNRFFTFLILIGLAGLLTHCASTKPVVTPSNLEKKAAKTVPIEPAARPAVAAAEKLFKAGKWKNAAEAYQNIKQKFPGTGASEFASYRLGSLYYVTNHYAHAAREFDGFLSKYPHSTLLFDVLYNLAASEYQQKNYAKALQVLDRLTPEEIQNQGGHRAEAVHHLAAEAAKALGDHAAAVVHLANYKRQVEESKRVLAEKAIASQLGLMDSADDLRALMPKVSDPFTREKINERLAAISPREGALGWPSPMPLTPGAAAGAETALAPGNSGDKRNLGVALPLSGSLANYGKRALEGILLAAGVFSSQGSEFELYIEDTASNPAMAAQAIEKLYEEHNVIGVIGPISWNESLAAAEKAQELGLINLSLVGKEGVAERGPYLFQNALTPRVQMESLVKHCIEEKHFKRFAILAPENRYGEDMTTEFAAVATKLGGLIVGLETYPPDSKDFQKPVRDLAGLGDPRYRRMENAKLATFIQEQRQKTHRPSKARLQPIVDFDAIFIPDSPKAAAQIAASLAYFDVTGVPMLGTSEWNTDQLYKRGGRLVEGAIFPGALVLATRNGRQREFIRRFAEAYGSLPDLLAAQAFEAMSLLSYAAERSGGDRNVAVRQLMSLQSFDSPLGSLSFDPSRIALRALPILSLAPGGTIIEQ